MQYAKNMQRLCKEFPEEHRLQSPGRSPRPEESQAPGMWQMHIAKVSTWFSTIKKSINIGYFMLLHTSKPRRSCPTESPKIESSDKQWRGRTAWHHCRISIIEIKEMFIYFKEHVEINDFDIFEDSLPSLPRPEEVFPLSYCSCWI